MGLILDSSVLVTAERQGLNARQLVAVLFEQFGDVEVALSVISLLELAHGAARADTVSRRARREQFIRELQTGIPVYPVTTSIAVRAGLIDGENQLRGVRLPVADLLIAVTALELGYGVATSNTRHFNMIPGLTVIRV
jgi:predicted nucleic acid-binding protein